MGLAPAIRSYVEGFTRRSGIRVALDFPPGLGRLEADVELALFRIVQECLTTIHRHSGSLSAKINLSASPGRIILEVSDQGRGVTPEVWNFAGRGVGIVGMQERTKELGGSLEVKSCDSGTKVTAVIPLAPG